MSHAALDGRPLWVGMVHLPPLPGAPGWRPGDDAWRASAVRDAQALHAAGFSAVLVENFGDAPFFKSDVPDETIAALTVAAGAVRDALPPEVAVGINVLRNAGEAAVAIAAAAGLDFVRVNVLTGASVTDQGVIEGRAAQVMRRKTQLAPDLRIFADVRVKHARPLVVRPLGEEVAELLGRGGADAVIVSGVATGAAPAPDVVQAVHAAAQGKPVLLGSGADAETLPPLRPFLDGAIVGTALKEGGVTTAPVDAERARTFLAAL